jgi:hypothetical protein
LNIYLVPYTWARHVHVALTTGSCALLAWWCTLMWVGTVGPFWPLEADGAVYLGVIAGSIAGSSMLTEGGLHRHEIKWFLTRVPPAIAIAMGVSIGGAFLIRSTGGAVLPDQVGLDAGDATLVSLRYSLLPFAVAGWGASLGTLVARKFADPLIHMGAGISSGLMGAGAWYLCNRWLFYDLYIAGALGGLTWGISFGLLAWGIPDSLYAGWLRVLSGSRFGRRIPIDAEGPKERFVGHFPRGADLWLPVEEGVQELHVSISVNDKQEYRTHGLSQYPVTLKRFLEKLDLRYDPRRPAPIVTRVQSGDRIIIGDGKRASELEFIMLPREES